MGDQQTIIPNQFQLNKSPSNENIKMETIQENGNIKNGNSSHLSIGEYVATHPEGNSNENFSKNI